MHRIQHFLVKHSVLTKAEARYIRKRQSTQFLGLSGSVFVPKEISTETSNYFIYVSTDSVYVMSRDANKAKCLTSPTSWEKTL